MLEAPVAPDVHDTHAAAHQGVPDEQPTMASRRVLLGTEDRGTAVAGNGDELLDSIHEVRSRGPPRVVDRAVVSVEQSLDRSASELSTEEDVAEAPLDEEFLQ